MLKNFTIFMLSGTLLGLFFHLNQAGSTTSGSVVLVNNVPDSTFGESPALYATFCSGCHGEKMNAFVDRQWKHGNKRDDLFKGIVHGYADEGMPGFAGAISDKQAYDMADYILTGIKNVDRYTGSTKPASNLFKTEKLTIRLDTVVKGLNVPWGIGFLPKGEMLVTDRGGKMVHVAANGKITEVAGVPEVVARGQGGLMDVLVDPGYEKNQIIYLSYSKGKTEEGKELATTAIMKAKYAGGKLTEQQDIFIAKPYTTTRHHYGSRMVFGKDGYLYITVGERGGEKIHPQEIKGNDLGKVHRIKADGSIPQDNPFVKVEGASPSIYSYGHRNPQGMDIHPATGQMWTNEHGPRGGDEINPVVPGKNYGWPAITYGINYNGKPMAPDTKTEKPGMEQPFHQWTPSIGPSGLAFVVGDRYKGWEGDIMSGSLRFQYLNRSVLSKDTVTHEEILFKNIGRVRDIKQGPDGYLYMAVETPGIVYRLVPVKP